MFCLICHDAFQQQFTWSGNSLIPLVKHLYWNEALGMESGLILPMLTKKTMATGNNELIENVVSMITAIYFDFVRYYVKNNKLYIEVREHR